MQTQRSLVPQTRLAALLALAMGSSSVMAQTAADPSSKIKTPAAVQLTPPAKAVPADENVAPPRPAQLSSILPEGKALPDNTYRFRVPVKFLSGSAGFDKDGDKIDSGFTLNAIGAGAVVEYGWTDRVSLQFLMPYVVHNELTFNKAAFLNRSDVREGRSANKAAAIGAIAQRLTGLHPLCPTTADCVTAISSGTLTNAPADLPLGSAGTIPSGAPILASLDAATEAGALARVNTNPNDGDTGLGDVQFGVLWELVTDGPVLVSVGGGLRLPTGSFKDVDTAKQRPTGRGTTDVGVRWNLDLPVAGVVMLSWQNQAESMLLKGKKKSGATEVDFERRGIRNIGFFKAAFAMAGVADSLKPASIYASYNYDIDGEERVDGVATTSRRNWRSMTLGLTVSGLEAGIPVSLDLEQERPIHHATLGTKNITLAPVSNNVALKAYMRF
jgi:hypothetical protein